jgi:hypothetical protein
MIELITSSVDAHNLGLHHPLVGDINFMAYFLMLGPQCGFRLSVSVLFQINLAQP